MAKPTINSILQPSAVLRRLILGWMCAVTISYGVLPRSLQQLSSLEGLAQMSLGSVCIMTCIFFAAFSVLGYFRNNVQLERWLIVTLYALLAGLSLIVNFHWAYLIANCVVIIILIVYAWKGWDNRAEINHSPKRTPISYRVLLIVLGVGFILFVSIWTVSRICSFCTPTYDFGIFSQMFYNMKSSGLPLTTVERDGLLSHFHVHVSPIYYLLLPVYWLFPYPATLQVMQAVVLASGLIPLWLICRRRGLPDAVSLILCAVLVLYPAYCGGTSYDLHENAFLAPIILWLLYGIDRKNTAIVIVFSCLCLLVKEDAAVYVAVIGLYLLIRSVVKQHTPHRLWGIITGCFLLLGALIWFFIVTGFLSQVGDGVMTYRYQNFMYDRSGSLLTVVASVLLCPMKALYECVDPEKTTFIMQTLLPMLALPLFTRKYERYILLIPYVLVNLMPDYRYQHDIMFQYTFGSTACLMYLTAVNLADLKDQWKQGLLGILCFALSAVIFADAILPVAIRYPRLYAANADHYRQVRQTLQQIPDDASVSATTFYTTELSHRKVLYDVKYTSIEHLLSTEYVALAVNSATNYTRYETDNGNGFNNLCKVLEENGYRVFAHLEGTMIIYYKQI